MAPSNKGPTFPAPVGFTAIPVQFSEKQIGHHCLYAKKNEVKGESDKRFPQSRTLLVVNIPGYVTEEGLLSIFSSFGLVEIVEILEKPGFTVKKYKGYFVEKTTKGFKAAYVVFKNVAAAQKLLSDEVKTTMVLPKSDDFVKTGIKKWIEEYEKSLININALQTEIDDYMKIFDKKEKEKDDVAKEKEGVPDKEGWITVTKKGRRPGTERSEAMNHRLIEKEKKKRAQNELINFYNWQQRSRKKEHLEELRKKFEEDKRKIVLMRAQRKFRPY